MMTGDINLALLLDSYDKSTKKCYECVTRIVYVMVL